MPHIWLWFKPVAEFDLTGNPRTEGVGLGAAWLPKNTGCFEIASGIIL